MANWLTDQPVDRQCICLRKLFSVFTLPELKKKETTRKTNLLVVYFVAMAFFLLLSLCNRAQFLSWFWCVRCVNIVKWQIAIHFRQTFAPWQPCYYAAYCYCICIDYLPLWANCHIACIICKKQEHFHAHTGVAHIWCVRTAVLSKRPPSFIENLRNKFVWLCIIC